MVSLGIVGAGQFAGQFATLFKVHPDVDRVIVTDLLRERADELVSREGLDGAVDSFDALLESDVDAIAIFTQRWTHGPSPSRRSPTSSTPSARRGSPT
jgi:predicted dehydrogenase